MKKNSKKEKINPIIKDQKKVKNVKMNADSEDENVVKKFVIITIIIAIIVAIIYGVTEIIKDDETNEDLVVVGSINYDKVSVGTILNRPYDEYYVLIYDVNDNKAVLYSTLLTQYMAKSEDENYTKIYFCDLSNTLNEGYYNVGNDNKSNPNATKTEEFDFGNVTLLNVKDGKIAKYVEDLEEIKEILK